MKKFWRDAAVTGTGSKITGGTDVPEGCTKTFAVLPNRLQPY
jgi:hypothetical protein